MAIPVTINGTVYQYPENSEDAGLWGEEASAAFVALAEVVANRISGLGDIVSSVANLDNSQTGSFANINGFLFDQTQVRGVIASYRIERTNGVNYKVEMGTLTLNYNPETNAWVLMREFVGDGDVFLDITTGGQLQYKVVALSGQTSGFIRFETMTTIS